MDRLVVIVLNWNGIDDTLVCFESLLKQTVSDFRIIIVDNGSVDSSKEVLKKLQNDNPEKLVVLYNSYNKGFAGGVNTGISWALKNNSETVVLFNNDAAADKKWLQSLVNASQDKQTGIVTGLLLHTDKKTIDSTGEQYSKWGLPFPRNRKLAVDSAPLAGYTFGATGGASLYKTALFKDIGLFDEDFFAYYEDTDVSFRAQLAGWKVMYTPEAVAYHKQGATSNKIPGFAVRQTFKNLPLLFIKNVPNSLLLNVGVRFWLAYILMLGHAIKNGQGGPAINGWSQGVVLFWKTALPARRTVQRSKKVTDEYIKSILWPDLPPDQTGLRKLRRIFIGK